MWKSVVKKFGTLSCKHISENAIRSNSPLPLLNPSSHSREPSSNDTSPLPSTSSDDTRSKYSNSAEDLKASLEKIEKLIAAMTKPDDKETTADLFKEFKDCVKQNIPSLGVLFDKFGGATNGQVATTVGQPTSNSGNDPYREMSIILKDFGQLHWVGALLIIVGITVDRCSKVSNYGKELLNQMNNLRILGKYVLKIHTLVPTPQDEADETLKKAVRLICNHAEFFSQRIGTKRNVFTRFAFAESDYDKLVRLQNEISQLYPELNLAATFRFEFQKHMESERNDVEVYEASEDTVLVGNEKPVKEALLKLESYSSGVRALVLFGMPGVGKSAVGEKIVAELLMKEKFDRQNFCKLSMGSERKAISVNKLQQELQRNLSRTVVKPKFSDHADGQRSLRRFFRKQFENEPVLLYFDNVQIVQKLDDLLPSKLDTSLHPGSILLVTTTNQQVINRLEEKGIICLSYEVRELEEKQAKDLLLRKIFRDADIQPHSAMVRELMQYEENGVMMVRKLLKLCGGSPLAINCVGSFICGRGQNYLRNDLKLAIDLHKLSFEEAYAQQLDQDTRRMFMKKLKDAVRHACISIAEGDPLSSEKHPLDRSLSFAYKKLNFNPRIQEVFLDIVHFHVGRKWVDVEVICGVEELETLRQLSMVNRLVYKDGTSSPIVHVHDLLIGLGRKMANMQSKGRRLVVESEDELPECFHEDQQDVFFSNQLQRPKLIKLDRCKNLSAEQLDLVTRNLQYFELLDMKISGSCSKVPHNLEYLKARRSSLPFPLQELQKLVILDVDLTTSNLESIESMPVLQKLTLENSMSLKKLGPKLQSLTGVKIRNCPNFESIQDLNPDAVQQLEIEDCTKFSDFTGVSKLKGVERLSLAGFELTKFPEDFVIPRGVQIMDLSRNKNLRALPKFSPENKTRVLNLGSCSSLQEVSAVHFTSLEYLVLGGCAMLERLTLSDDNLQRLRLLDVQGCMNSKLQPVITSIECRTAPAFRLIGSEADNAPAGGFTDMPRRIKLSLKKTLTIILPASSFKAPARSMKACFTFPSSSHL